MSEWKTVNPGRDPSLLPSGRGLSRGGWGLGHWEVYSYSCSSIRATSRKGRVQSCTSLGLRHFCFLLAQQRERTVLCNTLCAEGEKICGKGRQDKKHIQRQTTTFQGQNRLKVKGSSLYN